MSPIACHMEALSPAERARRSDVAAILQTRLAESAETDAGIVFRWLGDDDLPPLIGEFVGLESRCCPFVRFRLDVSEEGGPIELQLSGRRGVKDFLVATFLAHR